MSELAAKIGKAIQHGRTIGAIDMTDSARDGWRAVYHALSADRPGLAGALLARAEAHVMRLSALYAILDGQNAIDLVHLKAALALWEFAEASTRLIFGDSTGDPAADAILRGVRTSGELSNSQMSDLFGRNVSGGRLERAKSSLSAAGLIHCDVIETEGRPRKVWRAGTKKTN